MWSTVANSLFTTHYLKVSSHKLKKCSHFPLVVFTVPIPIVLLLFVKVLRFGLWDFFPSPQYNGGERDLVYGALSFELWSLKFNSSISSETVTYKGSFLDTAVIISPQNPFSRSFGVFECIAVVQILVFSEHFKLSSLMVPVLHWN